MYSATSAQTAVSSFSAICILGVDVLQAQLHTNSSALSMFFTTVTAFIKTNRFTGRLYTAGTTAHFKIN
jgi:hypothetical protein